MHTTVPNKDTSTRVACILGQLVRLGTVCGILFPPAPSGPLFILNLWVPAESAKATSDLFGNTIKQSTSYGQKGKVDQQCSYIMCMCVSQGHEHMNEGMSSELVVGGHVRSYCER